MIAITAPVALRSFDLPSLRIGADFTHQLNTRAADQAQALAEMMETQSRSDAAMARVLRSARQVRALGLRPDVAHIIQAAEEALPILEASVRNMAEAELKLRSLSPSGLRGRLRAWLQPRVASAEARLLELGSVASREAAASCSRVRAFLNELQELHKAPTLPPEEAPVNRAFNLYRTAILKHMPDAEIADDGLIVTDLQGIVTPVLTVRVGDVRGGEDRISFEELAHADVEAVDPSLVGLLAIDYVPTAAAA